ncbi:MAG: hypothetical protein EOM87_07225, partial [Clostridia bacterium]|nr:hypothetical protein [Clostridia bacterium]
MSDYILLPQPEGKPILWEYCRPETDGDNVVSLPQSNGKPIIAKCPTPTTDGENVIAIPQPDGKYIICGKCGADRCVYDNKIAYLGYAEIDVPDGGVYLEDIAALNTWMLSSDNYHSIIMVSGSITIDAAISVPSASSYKFIGENNAKFINENAAIQEIVSSGNCPCLIFQNIEFYATVNYILDNVKGIAYADGIDSSRRGYVVNMTDETIYAGYVCKFVVDGSYTRLYKPDENNLENIGIFKAASLASSAQVRTNTDVFGTMAGLFIGTVNAGQYLSSQADSWEFAISDTSGTFFVFDDNEDDTYDFVREQTYLARFINCTFSYIKTDSDISIFRDVSYTDFINCDFSGMESDNEYDLTIGIGNFGSFSGCDFTGCVGSKNLTISAYIIDDCDFTNCISGYGVEDGNTTLTIHTAAYTGGRIINQSIDLTAHDSSGSARHGNNICICAAIYINSDISITASDGVGYWDNAPTRYECANGG